MEYALYNMQFIFDEIFARQTLTALSDDGEKRKWLDCERVLQAITYTQAEPSRIEPNKTEETCMF